MSRINLVINPGLPSSKIHHLPCRINHNGSAKVEDYFLTSIRKETSNEKEKISATFRGRPLDGEHIQLPDGYSGVILKETHKPFNEDEDRKFQAVSKFDEFTEWHLSSQYSSSNTTSEMMKKWIPISDAIHTPINFTKSSEK